MTKKLNDEPEFAVELGEDEIEVISGGGPADDWAGVARGLVDDSQKKAAG